MLPCWHAMSSPTPADSKLPNLSHIRTLNNKAQIVVTICDAL